jgi:regulator of replication initiation timing
MSVVLFPEIPEGIEQENKALRAENEELRSLLQQENNGRNYENMIYAARLADCEANIRKLEEENAALKDQIKEKAKLEKTTVEPHIILKRAIAILKYI